MKEEYRTLSIIAEKHYNQPSLLSRVNIFSSEDLLHDFLMSSYYMKGADIPIHTRSMKRFIGKKIRDAKNRNSIAREINESDLFVLQGDKENYRDSELVDGYVFRNSGNMFIEPELYDGNYYTEDGDIDTYLMTRDMQKEMSKHDRMYKCTHRRGTYFAGNPLAIPISALEYKREMESCDDGMG